MTNKRPQQRSGKGKARTSGKRPAAATGFARFLKPLIPAPARPVQPAILAATPLAHLDYALELELKSRALASFWAQSQLAGMPESLVPSPKPRHYRTTTKRKVLLRGQTFYLLFGDLTQQIPKKPFLASVIEPREHERIYRFLQTKLSEPSFQTTAAHLNYIIIRGSYAERAVIFNVDAMNGPLIRKLKILASHLQKIPDLVAAAFVYPDPSRSDYYLESRRPADIVHFKKLFGPDNLLVSHEGCRYRFHPTSFSQINESMVPEMLRLTKDMLCPAKEIILFDLYCGYGLFSHFLAPYFKQVTGIDSEGPSIKAAIANCKLNTGKGRPKFLARRITGDVLAEILPDRRAPEAFLLDPPRQGPQSGVITEICRRRPQHAVHIFCNVDQIPASIKEWRQNRYRPQRIVPLDMFPGSTGLEVLVHLTPQTA